MPTFLPPTAASSEVIRTLNEKNEAEKTFEARKADVEIASEEIAGAKSAIKAQEATVQLAEKIRLDLEAELQTAQYMASYFTLSAQQRETQITEHVLQIQLLEDRLKARQKDAAAAQQNRISAIEVRDQAEAKLQSAKADHEKAFEVAKARGLLPDLTSFNTEDKRKSKSPERRSLKERGSGSKRSRSRSRSPRTRLPDRRRSRSRDRLVDRDRRRPLSPVRRRGYSPIRRRTSPRMWSPIRRGPPPWRRTPLPSRHSRPRSRSRGRRSLSPVKRRRSRTPDRKRRRESSPKGREQGGSPSPGAQRAKPKAKTDSAEKLSPKHAADEKRNGTRDSADAKAETSDRPINAEDAKEARPSDDRSAQDAHPAAERVGKSDGKQKNGENLQISKAKERGKEGAVGDELIAIDIKAHEGDDAGDALKAVGDRDKDKGANEEAKPKKEKKEKKHKKEKKEKKSSKEKDKKSQISDAKALSPEAVIAKSTE